MNFIMKKIIDLSPYSLLKSNRKYLGFNEEKDCLKNFYNYK